MNQQPMSRHVAPLRHTIPIPSEPVFVLTLKCWELSRGVRTYNLSYWRQAHK